MNGAKLRLLGSLLPSLNRHILPRADLVTLTGTVFKVARRRFDQFQ